MNNKSIAQLIVLLFFLAFSLSVLGQNSQQLSPGIPDRSPELDVLPGFRNPPPGYGEVPFWWWTGDTLNTDRMIGQLRELHKKGISGVQVNYSHYDTPGWLTEQDKPEIFTEEWWKVYSRISEECAKLNMGIGLSTYTIDWPRGAPNLFYHLFYKKPGLNAIQLDSGEKWLVKGGERIEKKVPEDAFALRAYQVKDGTIVPGGTDLTAQIKNDKILWQVPEGEWEIWTFRAVRKEGSLNPLMAGSGDTIINGFFQKFQDRNLGKTSEGLNFFFNDELHIGLDKFAWNPDFADEFRQRKGYNLFEFLPAMWNDMGNITPKVRMDYADVRMSLMEERYFKPIYDWHAKRGMLYGCDSGGRGLQPGEFGDYFRATRWYSAPGHDTPGGKADLIKGKVSSSIANLYQRPRVWLEGYHSLGWGATLERLMFATRENFLYGCTLLNLHGLYYTTYGSYWEWAPPCYHFRMPYWEHMDVFLGYFERLSYLMSQGHTVSDVAVVYPVAPFEAEMDGEKARNTAFELGRSLMAAGINFEFIDNESLARAVVEDGLLKVKDAGAAYRALVFPNMSAVRWPGLEKAADFAQAGGKVYSVGALPSASDREGRNDKELEAMNERTFTPSNRLATSEQAVESIRKAFVQDVQGIGQTVRALHRKAGPRDIYMVMDSRPGVIVEFRTKGAVELWDPWTGNTAPLRVTEETATGTMVELPLETYEASLVVFTPGRKHVNPLPKNKRAGQQKTLPDVWTVSFLPTMDNKYGDFRMPVTADNQLIGLEARRFAWARETKALVKTAMLPATEDSLWEKKLHGFGTQFYVLGPVSKEINTTQLEAQLARLTYVDPAVPVNIDGNLLRWHSYDFSWRYGKEGDSGHQGYHGLKRTVTDDFLCMGKPEGALNETRYADEIEGGRYYLWSCATVEQAINVDIHFSNEPPSDKSHTSSIITPVAVYVNGIVVEDLLKGVALKKGVNPLLVRYDHAGRGHFVLRRQGIPSLAKQQPLNMKWSSDEGVIPFDVSAGNRPAEWFRFKTAPGTSAIRVRALGVVEAWINGEPMRAEKNGRFVASKVYAAAAIIALRVQPDKAGLSGGGLIPEPVTIETNGAGVMTLGDWSKMGILNNYSGGIRYRSDLSLTATEAKAQVTLDLGKIAGTSEIIVNGRKVGVRVAPPWKQDVTGFLKAGENTIEVLVYNTLANHYQTIPSLYRGDPLSGMLGPVKLLFQNQTKQDLFQSVK